MWIPEPSITLPHANRDTGVCIGDVGLFQPKGSFDFPFNVCHNDGSMNGLPDDDRINFLSVPDGFQQQDIPPYLIPIHHGFLNAGAHVKSRFTKKVDISADLDVQL
jgi:hypothetical protein